MALDTTSEATVTTVTSFRKHMSALYYTVGGVGCLFVFLYLFLTGYMVTNVRTPNEIRVESVTTSVTSSIVVTSPQLVTCASVHQTPNNVNVSFDRNRSRLVTIEGFRLGFKTQGHRINRPTSYNLSIMSFLDLMTPFVSFRKIASRSELLSK